MTIIDFDHLLDGSDEGVGDPDWVARSARVGNGVGFRGWTPASETTLSDGSGGVIWLIGTPQLRRWGGDSLLGAQAVEWTFEDNGDATMVRAAHPDAELDWLELRGRAAAAFTADVSEPLTLVPLFEPIAGPRELNNFLIGGRVVAGKSDAKMPVDQFSLSLYRVARLRGGAFWEGVAEHVAAFTAARFERAAKGRAGTGIRGDEIHTRYLTDGLLLLVAHAEHTGSRSYGKAAERAARGLETMSAPWKGGRWYLHDSAEQGSGRNDLVLNTHLHAITAVRAAGEDVSGAMRALDTVLAAPLGGYRGVALGMALGAADLGRRFGPRRIADPLALRLHRRLAVAGQRARALVVPGGFIARDASGVPAPWYYLIVNLADLAVLDRHTSCPRATAALTAGLAYARRSSFFEAELRRGEPLAVAIPTLLRNAGRPDHAEAVAERARAAGLSPAIGWPGFEDRLWSRLPPGTP